MDLHADSVAGGHVGGRRRTDLVARELPPKRLALEGRYRLTGPETQPGVKTERAIVVAGLQQAYASFLLPRRTIKNVLHQAQPEAAVLCCRINGDRSDAGNAGSLVEEITADDLPLVLGDDRVEARMGQRHG